MMQRAFLIIIMLLIMGCQLTLSDNIVSPLRGKWLTDTCSQMTGSGAELLDAWGKGIYQFYPNGALVPSIERYSDSSCTGASTVIETFYASTTPFSFQDLGEVTLQEGIQGGKIILDIDDGDAGIRIEGFYTINNDTLCLSDKINLEPFAISSSNAEGDAIDFAKCLSKISRL